MKPKGPAHITRRFAYFYSFSDRKKQMSFLARSLRLLAPRLNVTRVTVSRSFVKPVGGDEEYEKGKINLNLNLEVTLT